MRKNSLKRRSFLKGSGSVLIALPLLEEAFLTEALAQSAMPTRCLTMSFGLGIERSLQKEKFDGPLEPFRPIWDKMAFFSNLKNDHLSCLLYTSPSPRDLSTSRMPSSA